MNARPVKYLDKLFANIVKNHMVIPDTDDMPDISLAKYLTCGFGMTTGHKYEFKLGLYFPKDLPYGLSVHFDTFTDVIFEKEIILFLLDSMAAEM